MKHAMHNVIWFRADLRVHDNPALNAAMRAGPTIAIYCLSERQWDEHFVSKHKRSLIVRQLESLAESLAKLNVPLKVVRCMSFASVPADLLEFCCHLGGKALYFNYEYEFNERKLSRQVRSELAEADIKVHGFHDQCAIAPGQVLNKSGEMYQVFTAFKNQYLAQFDQTARAISKRPEAQAETGLDSDLAALKQVEVDKSCTSLWPAGEDEAHERLDRFIEERILDYKDERDFPDLDSTSALSPYFAVGILSTSQCFSALINLKGEGLHSEQAGIKTWTSELVWREFYRHLMVAFSDVCKFRAFKSYTDQLPWRDDEKLFRAWCEGKTGYPIVDAGMRQLNSTGWMHNRLRMVCAMFLSKHLFLDWRLGERYFMENLVDADFASNNGGWQWSASTGVDAAPYFRIFSPVRQSQRFDVRGRFIARFVPELAQLDNKSVHEPSSAQRQETGYPEPIVDHKSAVENTKRLFSEANKASDNE